MYLPLLPCATKRFVSPGESVDDCGGGYSESVAEMCDELMNGSLPLLIPTPNGRDEAGTSRDCFLMNPQANSQHHLNMFTFLGRYRYLMILSAFQLSVYKSKERSFGFAYQLCIIYNDIQ